jgi:hypothetical protein
VERLTWRQDPRIKRQAFAMLEAVRIRPVLRSELGYLLASIRGRPELCDGAAARVAACRPYSLS